MFETILSKIYYGNSVESWIIALSIILTAFIIGKAVYWILGNVIKKITAKTETKLDDILIDMMEEPAMLAIILAGFWYGINSLNLAVSVIDFLDKAMWVVIILNIAWFISRFFEALVTEYLIPYSQKSESEFDDHLLPIARRGVKIVIWLLAIIVALDNAGYNIGAVLAGLGIGGLALAMAAKDIVANIFGGVTVFMDKSFKVKDTIKIAGFSGAVEDIGMRSTKIKTDAGTIITIPNSTFTASAVENISLEPSRKITSKLLLKSTSEEKDVENALKLLEDISKKNLELITKDYKIGFTSFTGTSFEVTYVYHIKKSANILDTQTKINLEILKQFNKNKITIL